MLKKILAIKNVGRFLSYGVAGDVELRRYNLVFAENGRGKTTLCAILRSLQSGDPAYVIGRSTLGVNDAPAVTVLLSDNTTAVFADRTWSTAVRGISIFDSTFISDNVFSGDNVDIDHKRSLYRVIVGKDGVVLAREIEALDAASRDKSSEIRERIGTVQTHVPKGMTVDEFVVLPMDPAVDDRIAAIEKELDSVRQASQIKAFASLSAIALPGMPAGIDTLLAKTIAGVSEDVGRRVADQIRAHEMHGRGEAWLSEGVAYIRQDNCPFCTQTLVAVSAVTDAYQAYFGAAYKDLRGEITSLRQRVATALGDRQIADFEKAVDSNASAADFWLRHAEITPPALPAGHPTGDALRTLREAALALLDRKAAAPLTSLTVDAAFTEALAAVPSAQHIATYNQAVGTANVLIAARKAATGAADVKTVEADLGRLRAMKARHGVAASAACEALAAAQIEKAVIETTKEATRTRLDSYTTTVIGKYEQAINQILDDFNAGFRITETKHGYPGGVASSSYQILINNTPVDLGDSKTPNDKPSFRNTLSAGDKSTLALAFFLAQIDHDPDKATRIVVFDDPFNSQDSFRKDCTVQKIKRCGEVCAQVIVFSHDPFFLKRIWDRLYVPGDRKCLEMLRIGQRNTSIAEWDIEQATQAAHSANLRLLTEYYQAGEGNPRDVVQKIRPVLETHSKLLGAGALLDNDTLGTIIVKIRGVGPTHQLFPICEPMEELNEYTKRYHHGDNAHAATEAINDGELQGYVKRTLEITGCC